MTHSTPRLLPRPLVLPSLVPDVRADSGALAGVRHHANISTDIGGTDFERGTLGDFFALGIPFESQTRTSLPMGDTPTVCWLLRGEPEKFFQPGWGGRYVRAWTRTSATFDRLTNATDRMEIFGILELVLPAGDRSPAKPKRA